MDEFVSKSAQLSPEMIRRFKQALELGKWPDGRVLTAKQKETLMEAIIIYDNANMPSGQRVGDLQDQCESKSGDADSENPLKWQ